MFHKILKSYHNNNPWDSDEQDHPDGFLWLLTPEELETMPKGIVLESIMGVRATVGKDNIDDETRFGYLAYGLRGYRED